MRRALPHDIPALVALMKEFYAESGFELDPGRAEEAFAALLADDRLGYIWLIESDDEDVGYVVLTLRFAMEYGGLMACLDDLYVVPRSRNKGLSTAALREIRKVCEAIGVCAITVEVGHDNGPAQRVYRRLGMSVARGRQLLVLPLRHPTHVV